MGNKNEVLEIQLLLEAKEAVEQLLRVSKHATELSQTFEKVRASIIRFGEVNNKTFTETISLLQKMTGMTDQLTEAIIRKNSVVEQQQASNLESGLELLRMQQMGEAEYQRQIINQTKGKMRTGREGLVDQQEIDTITANYEKRIAAETLLTNEESARLKIDGEIELLQQRQMADKSELERAAKEQVASEALIEEQMKKQLADGLELLIMRQKADTLYAQQVAHTPSYTSDVPLGPATPTLKERLGMDIAGQYMGSKNVADMATQIQNLQSLNPSFTFQEIGKAMRNAGADANTVASAIKKVEPAAKTAGHGFDILRTAMGFLTAMALSAIFNAISQLITKVIDSVSQLEQSFIKLSIAERALSDAGVDILPQQLMDIAKRVSDTFATVSNIDAQQMVTQLAVLTKDLGLTADQYDKLAMVIPLVAQQAGVSIDSATTQIVNGITKNGRGLADLGITVNATIIRERVLADNLVASADAYDNLTAAQQQSLNTAALINIIYEKNINNMKEQDKYNNTLAGSQGALNSQWERFTTALGKFSAPVIIQFLQQVTKDLKAFNDWIEKNSKSVNELSATLTGLSSVYATILDLGSGKWEIGLAIAAQTGVDLGKIYTDSYKQAKEYQANMSVPPDNKTAKISLTPELDANTDDIKTAFADLKTKLEDEARKLEQDKFEAGIHLQIKLEDIDIDYAKKVEDIIRKYNQSLEDAARDYSNKVQDINSETNQKLEEAQSKHRNDDIKAEQDFKNQMLKLREDYLMDLEDALHERDARQVLRLMKQYALNKSQATREYNTQKQQRDLDFQQELIDIAAERERKLQEARIENDRKLEEMALAKQRELEEADIARKREQEAAQRDYQRTLEDLDRKYQEELKMLGDKLQAEYELTASQAEALAAMLAGQLSAYDQYISDLLAKSAAARDQLNSAASTASSSTNDAPSNTNNPWAKSSSAQTKFAEGGTLITNRPTTALFGEHGAEMATFMPLNRIGKNMNKVFGDSGMLSQGGGNLTIQLDLSPDLESRIVSNTLNETARVIMKTRLNKGL